MGKVIKISGGDGCTLGCAVVILAGMLGGWTGWEVVSLLLAVT